MANAKHQRLVTLAKEAIQAVFSDRSVSSDTTYESLGELSDEIDMDREAIKREASEPDTRD